MKKSQSSQIKQLSKNVFAFIKGNQAILFNKMNFDRKYLDRNSFILTEKLVQEMERKTPEIKFHFPSLRKIRIEITLKCNCACDYCLVFKNNLYQINESMDKNTARKIIDFYKRNIKNGSLMITGGEPFLNWPVVKLFIENIKDPIKIFTNGTIINEEIFEVLRTNKNIQLMVSLDGKRKDNKKRKFSNGKEVYSTILKNIKFFQKTGRRVGIACLCSNENVNHLYEITKFFVHSLGIKQLGLSFPHYISNSPNERINCDIEKYTSEMIKIFNFSIKNNVYVDQLAKRFSPLITKKFRFYSCKLLGEQITFYPNGNKTFCTKIDILKNRKKYTLKYFQNTIPINNKFCEICPAIGICGGGCFWDGIMRFKHGVDERECVLNKTLLDYFLWNIYFAEEKGINIWKKFNSLIVK